MRTWWIIRNDNGVAMIVEQYYWPYTKSTIGPYFSYKEAMAVLHRWSK